MSHYINFHSVVNGYFNSQKLDALAVTEFCLFPPLLSLFLRFFAQHIFALSNISISLEVTTGVKYRIRVVLGFPQTTALMNTLIGYKVVYGQLSDNLNESDESKFNEYMERLKKAFRHADSVKLSLQEKIRQKKLELSKTSEEEEKKAKQTEVDRSAVGIR